MKTATDLLASIAREGATRYASTSLATSHAPVTRRVRRHRTTRAAVTAVAGVGLMGSGAWWLASATAADVGPGGVSGSPDASGTEAAPPPVISGVGTHEDCLAKYDAATDPAAEFSNGEVPVEALCVVPGSQGIVLRADAALALEAALAAYRVEAGVPQPVAEGYRDLAGQEYAADHASDGAEPAEPGSSRFGLGLGISVSDVDDAALADFADVAADFGWVSLSAQDDPLEWGYQYEPGSYDPMASRLFTLIDGRTVETTAQTLADAYRVDPADAMAAIDDAVARRVRGATTSEGWIAPGTYDLVAYPTLERAVEGFVAERVAFVASLGLPEDEWQDLVTTASLVEREAKSAEDRPLVASVIANRLAAGMRLELDSTVKFISPSDGAFTTDADRAIDSPYNTYLYVGLPPGAVATPSDDAIRAALEPAQTDYLFFVTINLTTGETAYASTFEEHLANVALLQEWIEANGQ